MAAPDFLAIGHVTLDRFGDETRLGGGALYSAITAHRLGVCVVAVFTKDVAETKATRATDAGRAKGYPLLFTTEPEE